MVVCRACHEETSYEFDPASGTAYCPKCGSVAEENGIVAEVTFGENSTGAAVVTGSYVGSDQTRVKAPGGRRPAGAGGAESREQTIANGRRKIQAMINALKLPDRFTDQAQRFYSLALNNNFVRGRRTNYVVSACLYIVCRMEKTSHMLIDFSDLLQVNVFILGSTYLKLVKDLNLTIPAIDPSLFISRFASLLEFGDETQQVANDATRLVQRFSRDWMQTGRRPAGICGAALILAARMNNFRRSIEEIVQVVKIADVTLKKRLNEFSQTASSNLTIYDFRTVDLTETADPPAFADEMIKEKKKERAKAKKVRFSKSGVLSDEEAEEDEEEEDEEDEEDENAERAGQEEVFAVPRRPTTTKQGMQSINAQMAEMAAAGGTGLAAEEEEGGEDEEEEEEDDAAWSVPLSEQDEEGNIRNAIASITAAEEGEDLEEDETFPRRSRSPGGTADAASLGWNANKQLPIDTRTAEEIAADEAESAEITNDIASELTTPHYSVISSELTNKEHARWVQAQNPAALHVGSNSSASGLPGGSGMEGFQDQEIDTLSDLDEEELDALILTEEEVRIKERLWMEFNKDYLANVAEKHLRAELDEKPIKRRDRKKKQQPRDSSMPSGETAAEAAKSLLKQKKFSKKINYAAIDKLLAEPTDDDDKFGDANGSMRYGQASTAGGFFDDDGGDAVSRSSRASSMAPSLIGSENGSTYTSNGLLKKRKRMDDKNRKRKSSASIQDAERYKRRLEAGTRRAFSPTKRTGRALSVSSSATHQGNSGNATMNRVVVGGRIVKSDFTGDPSKRARMSGNNVSNEDAVSVVGTDIGSVAGGTDIGGEVHHDHGMHRVEEEEEVEDYDEDEALPAPAGEDDDEDMAEWRKLRGQSGGDEYGGDDGEGWD
ncbi:BRF1-domain-containing protein [Cystobasidium minutum MCA 4210]|uniref:BRF1-domain-containing protein n=1 Tax=Cystobasidium minutum MCA 4210 TaxID=1397322 RepID=UPI0034CE949D|eukprot:jgi/Rhomi1/187798/estExt_fgenesh1_pg.C_2_t10037